MLILLQNFSSIQFLMGIKLFMFFPHTKKITICCTLCHHLHISHMRVMHLKLVTLKALQVAKVATWLWKWRDNKISSMGWNFPSSSRHICKFFMSWSHKIYLDQVIIVLIQSSTYLRSLKKKSTCLNVNRSFKSLDNSIMSLSEWANKSITYQHVRMQ